MTSNKNYILTREVAEKKMQRMAYEIVERNPGENNIILAGITKSGLVIANKINAMLQPIYNGKIYIIEITLDKKNPSDVYLSPLVDFNDKVIIIIDDVVSTGRTLLYALKPFLHYHPKKIQTLVLVERTHKAFPVNSDYVGLSVSTTFKEHIVVEVDNNEILGAYIT